MRVSPPSPKETVTGAPSTGKAAGFEAWSSERSAVHVPVKGSEIRPLMHMKPPLPGVLTVRYKAHPSVGLGPEAFELGGVCGLFFGRVFGLVGAFPMGCRGVGVETGLEARYSRQWMM